MFNSYWLQSFMFILFHAISKNLTTDLTFCQRQKRSVGSQQSITLLVPLWPQHSKRKTICSTTTANVSCWKKTDRDQQSRCSQPAHRPRYSVSWRCGGGQFLPSKSSRYPPKSTAGTTINLWFCEWTIVC